MLLGKSSIVSRHTKSCFVSRHDKSSLKASVIKPMAAQQIVRKFIKKEN